MRARWMEEGTVWFDHDCVGGLVALLFVGRWGVVFLLSRLVWRFSTSTQTENLQQTQSTHLAAEQTTTHGGKCMEHY